MKKVGATSTETVKGIDISHWQPKIDLHEQKLKGIEFCFIKASEGAHGDDQSFDAHWVNAQAAGMLRGAYSFYHPAQSPMAQAKKLASKVGVLKGSDLPCVLDWETTDGVPSTKDVIGALEFLNGIEALTGKTPIIYGSPYFLQGLGMTDHFKKYPLWIANYGVDAPLVPAPWDTWTFWQYADKKLDMNLFNGSLDELKKLAE